MEVVVEPTLVTLVSTCGGGTCCMSATTCYSGWHVYLVNPAIHALNNIFNSLCFSCFVLHVRANENFAGMWTQSKNKFNNDYQLQMLHPIPIHCDAATAQGSSDCAYLSEAGTERNFELMQQCSAGNEGRCLGWELMKITNRNNIHGPKFQWRHSCREDGSGCTHLMMHADVSIVL